jgi:ATP-dependent RNA helicase RhlE
MVGRERKKDLLAHMIQTQDWHQVLVFTRMKHGANRLVEFLDKAGISAMAIHGNKSQGARTKALAEFKNGDLRVLVATDIAARGIDIDQLPHVVNFELPNVPEDYVHRIGRTGRAGAQGEALSLVCLDEEGFLSDIQKLIKRELPRETISGFDIPSSERAEPIQIGRRTLNGSGGGGGSRAPSRDSAPRRGGPAPERNSRGGAPTGQGPRGAGGGQPARPAGPNGPRPAAQGRPGHAAPVARSHAGEPRRDSRDGGSNHNGAGGGGAGGNAGGGERRSPAPSRSALTTPRRGS